MQVQVMCMDYDRCQLKIRNGKCGMVKTALVE